MEFSPELKQRVQLALALAIAVAAIRTGYVLYERHASNKKETQTQPQAAPPLNPDYYVTPKKLYPYDLKSARALTEQPVCVKERSSSPYFPYNPATHRTNFESEAGMLLPIQRLEIKDVVTDVAPNSGGQKQVMALFAQDGKM